jgi:hypothetical protein
MQNENKCSINLKAELAKQGDLNRAFNTNDNEG